MKTFFASDLHFGHRNILKYEPMRLKAVYDYTCFDGSFEEFQAHYNELLRRSKEEHDKEANDEIQSYLRTHDRHLIDRWNTVVSDEDTVWFLGDLSLNLKKAEKYARQLKGKKNMILGNHDSGTVRFYQDIGFKAVSRYPVILKQKFILSHAPLNSDLFYNSSFIQIYGHVHSNPEFRDKTKHSICACMERHTLTPFQIPEFDECTMPDANFNSDKF